MQWNARSEAAAEPPMYRQEPAKRYSSVEVDVIVPSLQALIIAAAWALLAALAVGGVTVWQSWPWWIPPLAFAVVLVALFAWRVTAHLTDHRQLLWAREEAEQRDIDGDGVIGDPGDGLRLAYVHDNRRERRLRAAADFRFFLRECYNGRGTTWRKWRNANLPSGARMTRPAWEQFTNRMLSAGLATRPYDTAPLDLTSSYKDALATFREIL
jgi:hypothetical protein